eukprot:Clim_evm59s225 gene=Clim_evmTU59s225
MTDSPGRLPIHSSVNTSLDPNLDDQGLESLTNHNTAVNRSIGFYAASDSSVCLSDSYGGNMPTFRNDEEHRKRKREGTDLSDVEDHSESSSEGDIHSEPRIASGILMKSVHRKRGGTMPRALSDKDEEIMNDTYERGRGMVVNPHKRPRRHVSFSEESSRRNKSSLSSDRTATSSNTPVGNENLSLQHSSPKSPLRSSLGQPTTLDPLDPGPELHYSLEESEREDLIAEAEASQDTHKVYEKESWPKHHPPGTDMQQ